ncbi:MAG: selenide, water dikinase SelD [Candidatus Acidiferrum sp.]
MLAEPVKLTSLAKAAGCAAKLNPATLDSILKKLPRQTDPNVLVGFDTSDDAGIYFLGNISLNESSPAEKSQTQQLALVQTVDFFTPIVDNPFLFGQIAAANALSDVYAMGGRPISALSIVGFPEKGDPEILEQIIRGGLAKMNEAKCSVIGGHSIRNEDLLFGYAVTGLIDPRRIWTNVGARPGDVLIFTKPLGTGVITTALKQNRATADSLAAAVAAMTTLNSEAALALREVEREFAANQSAASAANQSVIHAVTDVSGFGLLGHAREMALGNPSTLIDPRGTTLGNPASGADVGVSAGDAARGGHAVRGSSAVSLEINHTAFDYFPGALEAAREGFLSGGLRNNRNFIGDCVVFDSAVSEDFQNLLFDPQTSGGLLVALDAKVCDAALSILAKHGVAARKVGRVKEKTGALLSVG